MATVQYLIQHPTQVAQYVYLDNGDSGRHKYTGVAAAALTFTTAVDAQNYITNTPALAKTHTVSTRNLT